MDRAQLERRMGELAPWFYDFDLGAGLRTGSKLGDEHRGIHETRRAMLEGAVQSHFGARLGEIRALDVGCHEGWFAIALRDLGVPSVTGVELRDDHLARARLVCEATERNGLDWRHGDCEELDAVLARDERFDLCLCFGLLYHLESPVRALRQLAARCRELLLIETQVAPEIDASLEWGRRDWVLPYAGHFALVDESRFHDNRETGATPLGLCPSPRALETVLRTLGFSRIETLTPPPDAHEQLARERRLLILAAR